MQGGDLNVLPLIQWPSPDPNIYRVFELSKKEITCQFQTTDRELDKHNALSW